MALPFFMTGASSCKFLNHLNKQIIRVFDKLPEERKLDLIKNLVECSLYPSPQDARQILPSVVQPLKIEPIEGLAKAMNKKLTQGMAEHNKAMTAAKREEEKRSRMLQLVFEPATIYWRWPSHCVQKLRHLLGIRKLLCYGKKELKLQFHQVPLLLVKNVTLLLMDLTAIRPKGVGEWEAYKTFLTRHLKV